MKKREGYEFSYNDDKTEFQFESIGPKGAIIKMVRFKAVEENLFSLAFGDKDSDDFDDEVISGNADIRKVVQPLVNIVHFFTSSNPTVRIVILPVDRKRKLLYNRIFQQFASEILEFYTVEGYSFYPRSKEFFDARKIYDAFVLVPEKPIFETH